MPSALGSPCQDSQQQQSLNVPAAQQAAFSAPWEGSVANCQCHDAVAAVHGLITRLLGEQHAQLFSLALVPCTSKAPHGHFTVWVQDAIVHVSGTSSVQLASGVHWFLKYFARCSVSWELTGGVQVDGARLSAASLAAMQARGSVTVERAVPLSFYQNVVTMSYSMAFWEWDRCAGAAVQCGFVIVLQAVHGDMVTVLWLLNSMSMPAELQGCTTQFRSCIPLSCTQPCTFRMTHVT